MLRHRLRFRSVTEVTRVARAVKRKVNMLLLKMKRLNTRANASYRAVKQTCRSHESSFLLQSAPSPSLADSRDTRLCVNGIVECERTNDAPNAPLSQYVNLDDYILRDRRAPEGLGDRRHTEV